MKSIFGAGAIVLGAALLISPVAAMAQAPKAQSTSGETNGTAGAGGAVGGAASNSTVQKAGTPAPGQKNADGQGNPGDRAEARSGGG